MSLAETLEKRAEQFVFRYGAVREEIGREPVVGLAALPPPL